MGRLVAAGAAVYSQVDFFLPVGSINRATGVVIGSLTLDSFVNGSSLPWPLVDGSAVSDSSISSGSVYFHEISGSPGFYSIRFFADRVGFWRFVLKNSGLQTEIVLEFDIIAAGALKPGGAGGLNASFIRT